MRMARPGAPPVPRAGSRGNTVRQTTWRPEHLQRGAACILLKGLVEAHGGRIWVECELGQGARFWFTVPRAHAVDGAGAGLRLHAE